MESLSSREAFELNHVPRIGRTGFSSRLTPYLEDIILLVLSHYTSPQSHEWLTKHKGVCIGLHAVGRFVKRIENAVENINNPVTRANAVLAAAISKAAAAKALPILPIKAEQSFVVTQRHTASAPKVPAQKRQHMVEIRSQISSQEIQLDRLPKGKRPPAERPNSGTSSRLVSPRAELDRKSTQIIRAAGQPQLMSSEELARMMHDIEDEASSKKE